MTIVPPNSSCAGGRYSTALQVDRRSAALRWLVHAGELPPFSFPFGHAGRWSPVHRPVKRHVIASGAFQSRRVPGRSQLDTEAFELMRLGDD